VRQTMFQPFVSEGKESGVGLGLTLAQQIAQEHNGGVEFSESLEGYTVFTITIPRVGVRQEQASTSTRVLDRLPVEDRNGSARLGQVTPPSTY